MRARPRPPIGQTCHYCPADATTWDHIVPRALAGPNVAANRVPACLPCNQAKADSPPTCGCGKCRAAWALWGAPVPDVNQSIAELFGVKRGMA